VGSAIVRRLTKGGYANIITATHTDVDLTNQASVNAFMTERKPAFIFLAAAKVGGIHANNTYPAEFIYDNLMIQCNVINAAYRAGVNRLLFLGSSCIYPRECPQPMKEEYLLTGPLEPTNEPYAVAKISGIKMCESYNRQYDTQYVSVMPTNLYGPRDNFNLENSHVLPALLRKAHEAKKSGQPALEVWGTGTPRREFLYVDDMADACVFLMEKGVTSGLFNVGTGEDVTIRELAETVKKVVGYEGELRFDSSRPDGTPRKLLSVDRLKEQGWVAQTGLTQGVQLAYQWFLENQDKFRA
jgi:GDP-L-fucose synthase